VTPNPDVLCNREVKFGAFFNWAIEQGADFVATGHYAEVRKSGNVFELHMSADAKKDQSYFLWTLNQKHLSKTLFPVGAMEKTEVRKEAERFNLPTATKKDSQGLCFIGKLDFKEFLSHFLDVKPGKVLDINGNEVGMYDGAIFYMLGERHGFRITKQSPDQAPLYVVSKNAEANTITVSERWPDMPSEYAVKELRIKDYSWTASHPKEGDDFSVRFRYRQQLISAQIKKINDTEVDIVFTEPIDYIPVGQSLVLYDETRLVGGGIISKTSRG
jgi:tRNA-specific 2-thiouridylase